MGQGLLLGIHGTGGLTEAIGNNGKPVTYSDNELSHAIDQWKIITDDGYVLIAECHVHFQVLF